MAGWIASAVSEVPAETPEGARANDVALISGQTNGAKAANLFAGFTDPGLTISTNSGLQYANRTDWTYGVSDGVIIQSTTARMDAEISGNFGYSITAFLRVANGMAFYFRLGNTVEMGWVTGLDLNVRTQTGNFTPLLTIPTTGLVGNQTTDVWTFGSVGFFVYAKYNGVEVMRFKTHAVMQAGIAAVWGGPYANGTSNVTISYLPASGLYSNRPKSIIDIRDFGASTFKTKGSISMGTPNQITVDDASGFAVGNRLIVPVSFEAGLGLRGTMGVGASWPYLSYADTTAMNADTSKANGAYSWDRSTGLVYIFNGTIWQKNDITTDYVNDIQARGDGGYYTIKAVPRALVATMTGKAGNVLTLDKSASAAVTNADVFFDNYPAFWPITFDGGGYNNPLVSNYTLRIPAGDWAMGQAVATNSNVETRGVTIRGVSKASRLFAPRGAPNIGLSINNGRFCQMSTLTVEGNHKPNPADNDRPIYYSIPVNSDDTFSTAWNNTINWDNSQDCVSKNIDNTDIMAFATRFSNSFRCRSHDFTLTMNARIMSYTQWYHTIVNGGDCGIFNSKVLYSRGLIKAFEFFVSVNPKIINCGGYNVLCSTNNSYNWEYQDFYSDLYGDAFNYINAGFWGEAVININNNSYHSASSGGKFGIKYINEHDYVTANKDTVPFIQVAADVTNVEIYGEYDTDTFPFSDVKKGLLTAPDYAVINPTLQIRGIGPSSGRGVIIEAPGTKVRGLRIKGASKSGTPNFWVQGTATGSDIQGNIADTFTYGTTITKSGNRTNAGVAVP